MSLEFAPIHWTQNSVGVGIMTRCVPKVDGDNRTWELSFLTDLSHKQQTEGLTIFPSGGAYHNAAVEEVAAADVKVKPLKGQKIHMDLVVLDDDGNEVEVLNDVAGEVRFVKLKLNTSVRVLQARVNLRGVPVELSNAIVSLLERRAIIKIRQDQQPLFAVAGDPDKPEVGQLVSGKAGDQAIVGMMVKESKKKPVVDDFGTLYTLDAHATTMWIESADGTDMQDHLKRYNDAAEKMDVRPTWSHLVEAMALGWAHGLVQKPSGNTSYINGAIVDKALQMHTTAALPAEAG